MKTEWICKWQMFPGAGKQTAAYSSRLEAWEAMAKVLSDVVDLCDYIQALRNEEQILETFRTKIDRKAIVWHLELLGMFEYNIQKCDDGCYIGK